MSFEKIRHWLTSRKWALVCSCGFAVLCILLLVDSQLDSDDQEIRLSAGPAATRRHAVAVWLCEQAAQNDLTINLFDTTGVEDSLKLLKSNQLDVAIISNGVVVPDDENITVLAAIQQEAVHVLVRKEMTEKGSLVEAIRGKRVNLGEQGSTEWLISRDFLSFMRLKLPSTSHAGDVIPTMFNKSELLEKSRAILEAEDVDKAALISELPECLFVLSSMPSPIVQALVEVANYQIVPVPATRAFLLDNLQDSNARTAVLEREFLEPTSIPKHSYFSKFSYPSNDCETIGVRLLVVARKQLAPLAVQKIMKTIFEGEFNHRITPKSPRDVATPYAIHPASVAYLDRDKPLIVNSVLEWLSEGLSIFGAFSAGALSLYSLVRRKKSRNPSDYFAEIRRVEQLAYNEISNSEDWIERQQFLKQLEERIVKLRYDLLEDICEGRIKGDQVVSNIMMLLNEARRNLSMVAKQTPESTERNFRVVRSAA